MIKLYGNPFSTCTRKVLTTLAETKTPYEFTVVDFAKGEHKQQPHLSRQPFGQVPAIDDNGFALYESRAICRYLSEKADSALTPRNPQQRAKMEQWLSVETSNFTPHAMKFVYNYIFKRPQEAAVLESANANLDSCLKILSEALSENAYFVGDQFTLADVAFMPYVEYLMGTPAAATLEKHPAFIAWWSRVSERPSWKVAAGK
jgi:glutathione S-transferase